MNVFGLKVDLKKSDSVCEKLFGLSIKRRSGNWFVVGVNPKSEASKHVKVNDEVLTINQKKMAEINDEYIGSQEDLRLGIKREGKIISREIEKGDYEVSSTYQLVKKENLSPEQLYAYNLVRGYL